MAKSYHYDDLHDRLTVHEVVDVEPVIEHVKAMREATDGRGNGALGYYVGTIPVIIIRQYLKEIGVTYAEFLRDPVHIENIMNNPDYSKFRVWQGRI